MKKIIVLFALICLSFACKKTNKDLMPQNKSANFTSESFDFDVFGITHNQALDYVSLHSNLLSMSNREKFEYCLTYSDEFTTHDVIWDEVIDELNISAEAAVSALESNDYPFAIMSGSGILNDDMEDFTNRLSTIFNDAYNETTGELIAADAFYAQIEELEQYVMDNYSVEYDQSTHIGNDGACMLGTCATAKYSFNYWSNAKNDPSNKWHPIISSGNGGTPSYRSVRAAALDAYAYITRGWIDTDGNGTRETWNSEYAADIARSWSASA